MKTTYVIVTFNRLELLKKTIDAALSMTTVFDDIIVVDNCSTDGTYEYLETLTKKNKHILVFHSKSNIGGAGGFSMGIEKALEFTDNEWIFLADDDAVPDKFMLETLYNAYENLVDKEKIAAICTSVKNAGKYDTNHRRKVIKKFLSIREKQIPENYYQNDFYVDQASFVGLMVKTEIIKKIGLPNKDFFIYYDDTEYSARIRRFGEILCVPRAIMNHDVTSRPSDGNITWRDYYMIRNKIFMTKELYPPRYYKLLSVYLYLRKGSLIYRCLKHRNKKDTDIVRAAIRDGKSSSLGIHKIYKP